MSNNPHNTVGRNVEENMFNRFAQRVVDHLMPTCSTMDKRFSIERLKALGATTFEGTTDLIDAKKWLSLIEKCFRVWIVPRKKECCCKAMLKTGGLSMQ